MANQADLTLAFWAPCAHCDAMLYGRVKFCPYCGKEESAPLGAGAAKAIIESERAASPDRSDTVEAIADWVVVPPIAPGTVSDAQEQVASGMVRLAPSRFTWHMNLPTPVAALEPTVLPPPRTDEKRLATGKVAALLSIALALVLGGVYVNHQFETARSEASRAKLAQARNALGRGDLGGAQRELAALVAADPNYPGVREFRDEVDQRMRDQATQGEQLRDAALKAAAALGLSDAAQSPAKTPPAAEKPAIAAPGPGNGDVKSREDDCSDALAAMALCTKEPVPPRR